jgi:hypothetical protein
MTRAAAALLALALSTGAFAKGDPDCAGPDRWPAHQAFAELRNEMGLTADELDISKTAVQRIASEKTGKDLYVQVHLVTFMKKTGEPVKAIAVNEVSHVECSMTGADVYAVSRVFPGYADDKEERAKAKTPKR